MSYYNFKMKYLSNLIDIEDSGKYYYKYKGSQFYYKKNNDSDRLVVCFHGAMFGDPTSPTGMVQLPIFRGFDWKYNVLCLSDKLLEDFTNKKLEVGWFLSPKNSGYKQIYTEIISFILKFYKNVIFHGSSAGGFPSLYFSCLFSQKALTLNSQFYIEKHGLFDHFTKIIGMKLEEDFEEYDSEAIVTKYGPPHQAYIYCNQKDAVHIENHFNPFKNFVEREKIEEYFSFRTFSNEEEPPPGKTHHVVFLPTNVSMNSLLDELFEK